MLSGIIGSIFCRTKIAMHLNAIIVISCLINNQKIYVYLYIYIYSVLNLSCRNFMVFSGFKTIFLNLAFSLSDLAINIATTQYSKNKRILMSFLDICDKFRTI